MIKTEITKAFLGAVNVQDKCWYGGQSYSIDPRRRNRCSWILFPVVVGADRTCAISNGFRSLVPGVRTFWTEYVRQGEMRSTICERRNLIRQDSNLVRSETGDA